MPGFGKKLAAKGVPTILYGQNVKYTLACLFEEAAPLREWRHTCIRLYTPREDLLFTSRKPEQLMTRALCAMLVTPGSIAKHPLYAATNLDWSSSWFRWLLGLLAGGLVVPSTTPAGNCGDVQRPLQTDTSVWDDNSTGACLPG